MSPIISVILPTYARYRTGHLKRAVDSYLNQDKDFQSELLIYDDCVLDKSYLQKIAQPILDNKCSVCYGKTRSIFNNSEMILDMRHALDNLEK